jgi:hypothetical protein
LPSEIIDAISPRYVKSSVEFKINQAAFNTIERNHLENTDDFKKQKIAAMLKLYHREIEYCSEEVDLFFQVADQQISKIFTQLPEGIFAIRALLPEENQKEELHGHSTVLINEGKEIFYYNPRSSNHLWFPSRFTSRIQTP